jgi:hypothetical protein
MQNVYEFLKPFVVFISLFILFVLFSMHRGIKRMRDLLIEKETIKEAI